MSITNESSQLRIMLARNFKTTSNSLHAYKTENIIGRNNKMKMQTNDYIRITIIASKSASHVERIK